MGNRGRVLQGLACVIWGASLVGLIGCQSSHEDFQTAIGSNKSVAMARPTYVAARPSNGSVPNNNRGIQQASYQQLDQPGIVVDGSQAQGMPWSSDGVPVDNNPGAVPHEKSMMSHMPYRVAPPDILVIDALRVIPKGPYKLEPGEVLQLNVAEALPNQPIQGTYMITPEGTIPLGYNYGNPKVAGLTMDDAQKSVCSHLGNILKSPNVALAVAQYRGFQQIRGQHLVRPDGTVGLGTYGPCYVAGMSLDQVKTTLERHLSDALVTPQISVDVLAYNSQKIYVIVDGGGFGQQVIPLPVTGNETVLDAVSYVFGLSPVSSKHRIRVARPNNQGCNVILPVDWQAITMNGQTTTNYQLFAGDRVYIEANRVIMFDNYLSMFLNPIERVFGGALLGNYTVRTLGGGLNNGSSGNGVTP